MSSIKVNGEKTTVNKFNHDDEFIPDDPYALSKYEAEQLLLDISRQSELEVVIIRPPLVYGPGVKANFLRLLDLVKSGFPLPFSSIQNARSMVSLDNLSDFIMKCIEHPSAANQVFLVSDGNDLSTPELVRKIATAMKKKSHMFSFPVKLLKFFSRLAGQGASVDRLVDSLQLNPDHSEYLLDWKPVQTTDEAIRKVVEWYLKR